MCGLTGFFEEADNRNPDVMQGIVREMATTLTLRGPDDSGEWVDANAGIALGFRRLAIVDLTPAGHQPMESASGRFMMVFNGEVYNFQEIRAELESSGNAPAWRGHSDTEVMLAAFEAWGIEASVKKFIGMFAVALWDRKERILHLFRDRLGVKPMYYGWMGSTFLFGSELKALKAHPAFRPEINRNALTLMLRHNYIPSPYSIYKGIQKLTPGTILTLKAGMHDAEPVAYWTAKDVAEAGVANPFTGSDAEAIEELDSLLRDATRLRMIADVPLGVFLSGGIDSSVVTALMQAQSSRPVKTFSIGFNEDAYNEATHAKAVAQHLGTEHTEFYVSADEALAVIPQLPCLYDEPFSDSSQIPTYLVSKLARQHVTVSLSGDGGDELFGGYNRYFWGKSIWKRVGWMPSGLRKMTASSMTAISPTGWDNIFSVLSPILPARAKQRNPGDKLAKLAEVVRTDTPEKMYMELVSHWKHPADVVVGACEPPTALTDKTQWANLPDFTQRMMFLDLITYLPDDILAKVDRASMGASLEAREPLLDHRLVEFAWRLPMNMKIRDGQGKWILRQVLDKYVPQALIDRPKMGFAMPKDVWLRGQLKDWAENLLDEGRLRREGFFDPAPIRQKWQEHLSGRYNWQYYLWDILMFQAWLEAQSGISG